MWTKETIKRILLTVIENNKPIIGVAVGSGLSAKQAISGGADFLLVLNAGRFRTMGVSSLAAWMPFMNSNEIVMQLGTREILPRVKNKPVIFGFCATDPTIPQRLLLDKIVEKGFHGVNNFPTAGLIDGHFREALEEDSLGFQQEVDFMKTASERGLFTIAFVFDEKQAEKMAKIRVDIVCAHLGLTVGGEKGAKQGMSLEEGIDLTNRIFRVVDCFDPEIIKMFYGGPITTPQDTDYFYKNTAALGHIGGSSFERIPTEKIIKETTGRFKNYVQLIKAKELLGKNPTTNRILTKFVGESELMHEVYNIINKVANKDIPVLIYGESGTGKEVAAEAIQYNSSRVDKPFIKINCAALTETILESELFGHEKGAFTGALHQKKGLFELAHTGILFLDEIGEMSLKTQAKLLRVIETKEFQRVGGTKTIKVDTRIICATNLDLHETIFQGSFRKDLYYRINTISIKMPSLRHRKEDIPPLVNHFLKGIREEFNIDIKGLAPEAEAVIRQYDWPGNVRELKHALENAAILCNGDIIFLDNLPFHLQKIRANLVEEPAAIEMSEEGHLFLQRNSSVAVLEKKIINQALVKFSGNKTLASKHLGITRRTLYNKIKKYNLSPSRE